MGETWKDRLSMAFTLAELGIRSIPINILIPVKGTPFGELEPMTQEDILRTVAILRYINPKADVRIAAGRNYFKDGGGGTVFVRYQCRTDRKSSDNRWKQYGAGQKHFRGKRIYFEKETN